MTVKNDLLQEMAHEIDNAAAEITGFLREIVRIPSYDSQTGEVGLFIAQQMRALGFDEARFDDMGNVIGRVGNGPCSIVFDSHIDTVGIGDRSQWGWDPLEGKIENGVLYARGACDEKGSTPPMIYALAMLKRLGLLDGLTLYYFGNMEEWCDGIAPHAFVEHEGIRPDFVVIGEPTRMAIYRGHRGRVEVTANFQGKSSHAAMPHLGINPLYPAARFIQGLETISETFADDPFIGKGTVSPTSITVDTPSLNAVPDGCEVYIDRRVTVGETPEAVLEQLRAVQGAEKATIAIPMWEEPSYTGFVFPVEKVFPAWVLEESHPFVQSGVKAYAAMFGSNPRIGRWNFSTNGIYWAGKAGIPSIGFGPGDEVHAHTVLDQVPLKDVVESAKFYAALPLSVEDKIS
jgi:putative selenium metabolism hydrolase